jgi:hypothetical protein
MMDEQRKRGIPRRRLLAGLAGGVAAAGAAAVLGARLHADAVAVANSQEDKRKSLYRESSEVRTYYRVNSYPPRA